MTVTNVGLDLSSLMIVQQLALVGTSLLVKSDPAQE
jgi:hypothetical protein